MLLLVTLSPCHLVTRSPCHPPPGVPRIHGPARFVPTASGGDERVVLPQTSRTMQQILFHLPQWLPLVGGMPIYGYGVMMVVGFFGALQLAKFLARRSGIDPEVF